MESSFRLVNASLPTTNPFASVRIRPGAIEFVFRAGESAALLVDRLKANGWRGQIVGPHGTGKSTLLESLLPVISAAGRQIVRVPLAGREVDLSPLQTEDETRGATIFVIDGFEQLNLPRRLVWRWYCWWRNCGLLVTTHRDLGLPMLTTTTVDDGLAQRVVKILLHGDDGAIQPAEVTKLLQLHHGNLRDTLFALYDIYELRRVANAQHQVSQH